jgi:rsbT antagonist protein RsbS
MRVPILKLGDILLTSVQEDLSDSDAEQLQADILATIDKHESRGLVIDISALDVVDSFFARVINETATMSQLLGAQVVLCGMQPAVALTLVEMGRELIHVEAALDLERGLERLQALLAHEYREDRGS